MSIKTILVSVADTPAGRNAVETAFLVGRNFSAHVFGLHVQSTPEQDTADLMMTRASLGLSSRKIRDTLDSAARDEQEAASRAGEMFQSVAKAMEAERRATNGGQGLTCDFEIVVDDGPEALAARGRIFDLVVVPQPWEDPDHKLRQQLRAVLFDSGRPVLVAPTPTPTSVGHHILIAWNRSALSGRAAAISRQYVRHAERVGILTIAGAGASGPSAQDLANNLAWHGIKAEVIEVQSGGRRPGEVLLDQSKSWGADLLIMGAYSQTPFRETLTGGITNYILSEAEMAVLMTH